MSRRWYVYVPIGLGILAILVWQTRAWEATDALARADPGLILLALALDSVVIVGWTMRSRRLLQILGHPISPTELVPIVVFANTVAALTPASLGEALRAVVMRRRHAVPYRVGAAVILIERVLSLYLLAAWTAVAVIALGLAESSRLPAALLMAGIAASIPLAVARSGVSLARQARRLAASMPLAPERTRRIAEVLGEVEDLVRRVLREPQEVAWFCVWTAVVFAASAGQIWLVARALKATVDPLAAWAALGSGLLAGILSALPFGLGAADAVFAVGLVAAGLPPALAALVALIVRVVNNLPTAALGAIAYASLSRRGGLARVRPGSDLPTS
jgi:hypothetical protein